MLNTASAQQAPPMTGLMYYLFTDGLITLERAYQVTKTIKQENLSLTSYLIREHILSGQQILDCCTRHFALPIFSKEYATYDANWIHRSLIKLDLIHRYRVLPLPSDAHTLQLGMTDPTDETAIAAIRFHTGLKIKPLLMLEEELDNIINTYCHENFLYSQVENTLAKIGFEEEHSAYQETHENDEPVIEFVQHLIQAAHDQQASDIHIEPYQDHCRVRFRCDGLLREAAKIPAALIARVITRLKILAQMDIAERRLPQDGRIQWREKIKLDMRISTCPTLFGEKVVLRLLTCEQTPPTPDTLGMSKNQLALFTEKISQPQGLILVTGPTGSGKTITLYSALHQLNQIEKNITCVEDPIEMELPGINQVNLHTQIGMDFASALRTLLRQDPDILMLGEIRDLDTAIIAAQAAQTGHLVLSTLHTNSAIETITRLQTMGVATHLLIQSMTLIVAQRLIRKLCDACKQPEITHGYPSFRAAGCRQCHDGYRGRTGVFELLPMTEAIAHHIINGATQQILRAEAKSMEMECLQASGLQKVKEGVTSYDEIRRVLGLLPAEIPSHQRR